MVQFEVKEYVEGKVMITRKAKPEYMTEGLPPFDTSTIFLNKNESLILLSELNNFCRDITTEYQDY